MLPTDQIYKLVDVDNYVGDDKPFQMQGDLGEIVAYIDGPVRDDLTHPDIHGSDVDDAIDRLADDQIEAANAILGTMGVQVELSDAHGEEARG